MKYQVEFNIKVSEQVTLFLYQRVRQDSQGSFIDSQFELPTVETVRVNGVDLLDSETSCEPYQMWLDQKLTEGDKTLNELVDNAILGKLHEGGYTI